MKTVAVLGNSEHTLTNFRGHLLQEMVARGHRVVACAPDLSPSVRTQLQQWGVEPQEVRLSRTSLNPVKDLQTLVNLISVFRAIKPDVLLSYTVKPVIYGTYAASLAGVPVRYAIVEGLGYAFTGESVLRKVLRESIKALYRGSFLLNQRVFFLNPDDQALFIELNLLKNPSQAIRINGIGVDLEHYQPVALPQNVAFLMIARLLKDKGIREYLEAARRVKSRHPEVEFHLVGARDANPSSLSEAELQKVLDEGVITYWGRIDDVRQAVAKASVFVLPSYREGVPRTSMECMAMGRPIITTDAPGCRETVEHMKNGLLVPVKNVDALVEAMQYFIENPSSIEKMGEQSLKIARDKFDVHKVNEVILSALHL